MSSSMLMSLGTRAMFAAYAQLQTTSNNISNANVAGYSRQRVILGTAEGQFTGSGFFGRGVTVQTVERASNMFLTQQAASTSATAASDRGRRDMLLQLEKVFGTGHAGLGMSATRLFNAFADLASAPAGLPERQTVLARAEDLASLVRSASDQIESLQANAFQDIDNAASEVNALAAGVAQLNLQITTTQGMGHSPNDLLDRRNQLVARISEKIEVTTVGASDGTLSLFIAGGQSLVLGGSFNSLVAGSDDFDPARSQLRISVGGQTSPLDSNALGGGLIHGLLQFQDADLAASRNRLGQLVGSLALAINRQQSLGLDLNGAPGAALFRVGAPAALPERSNARDALGNHASSVSLVIADATALQASEYELRPDPANAGQYLVTRLSDGVVASGIVDGSTMDGFTIAISTPPPQAGDRFLLKPVSTLAQPLALALDKPRGIAAANPITAVASSLNTGTASVAALSIANAPGSPYQAISLNFTDAAGSWEMRDAGNVLLASGNWTPGTPIAYNGFELSLNGVPASGDSVALAPTAFAATNNGNALALDGLAARRIVDGVSLTDAYASTLSDIGVRVQGLNAAADTSSGVAARAYETLTGVVGVNIDEEAAKLIEYQQAYQAAARMLQTAQSVMDTLLELGR